MAVREDGTAVSCGNGAPKVNKWKDAVAVVSGNFYDVRTYGKASYYGTVFGLQSDGTVILGDQDKIKQISEEGWTDIVSIVHGEPYLYGLRSDGTVVCYKQTKGNQSWNQQDEAVYLEKIAALRDVVKIHCIADWNSTTLWIWTADGTVYKDFEPYEDQSVIAVESGSYGTAMLKKDGTVTFDLNTDLDKQSQAEAQSMAEDVNTWTDVVSMDGIAMGLKADGTVVGVEYKNTLSKWTDIVAVYYGSSVFGLKSDGTLVSYGSNMRKDLRRGTEEWTGIRLPADRDALLADIDLDYITGE